MTRFRILFADRRRPAAVGLALLLALVSLGAARPDGRTRLTVFDIGQGDAILFEGANGGRVLIDGGPDPDRLLVLLDGRLPAWDRRIDLAILTHPHEDHVAGLAALLDRYRVGRIYEPGMVGAGPGHRAFAAALARGGRRSERLATGDRFAVDGVRFRVLWPDRDRVPAGPSDDGSAVNDSSIVLALSAGSRRFLLTGDAELDVEGTLVERGLERADVLKVGHHGSRTSSTPGLLAAVRPRVALVSVGARNRYGHPDPGVLERLVAGGARVFRTDRDGSITVSTDGRDLEVATADGRSIGSASRLVYDRRDGDPRTRRSRLPARGPARGARVDARLLLGRGRLRHRPRRRDARPRARRGGRRAADRDLAGERGGGRRAHPSRATRHATALRRRPPRRRPRPGTAGPIRGAARRARGDARFDRARQRTRARRTRGRFGATRRLP